MIRITGLAENLDGFVLERTFTYSGDANNGRTTLHFKVTLVDTSCRPDQWQCRAEFDNFDKEQRRCRQFAESEAIGSGDDPESALRKLADNLRRVADAIDGPKRLYNPPREMPPWVFPTTEPEFKPKAEKPKKKRPSKAQRSDDTQAQAQAQAQEGGEA